MLTEPSTPTDSTSTPPSSPRPGGVAVAVGVAAALVMIVVDPTVGVSLAVPIVGAGIVAMGDQRSGRLPNTHTAALFAATMLAVAIGANANDTGSWTTALAGAVMWSVPLFVMAVAGSFGGGDFKFAASLGAMCGWIGLPTAAGGLIAALVACCIAGAAVAWRARTTNTPLRLGLPLYVGTIATIIVAAVQ